MSKLSLTGFFLIFLLKEAFVGPLMISKMISKSGSEHKIVYAENPIQSKFDMQMQSSALSAET